MKKLIILMALITSTATLAKVTAMFHPYDTTFVEIASRIKNAKGRIDMALYNIDSKKSNPIIATITSEEIQSRIAAGELEIRLLFEGYESKEKNKEKMNTLESYGIDVKFLGSSRKMHHKFAIIDGQHLITGSANWSMSSRRNYNENILFFDNEIEMAQTYQEQFDLLWDISKEIGTAKLYKDTKLQYLSLPQEKVLEESVSAFFNTKNFDIKNKKLRKSKREGYLLTKKIVASIDQATDHIQIATTRIKLRPIFDAIVRASQRGVKIDIVVTMGQYEYKSKRKKMKLEACENIFKRECSTSKNFSVLLSRNDFEGSKNVNVRLKFFNLKTAAYLNKQMHSKYIIIDNNELITGSFNWSYSAEFNHIENIVVMKGSENAEIIGSFTKDFNHLWGLERGSYRSFLDKMNKAFVAKEKINCSFAPMSLAFHEIDFMLAMGNKYRKRSTSICK
jgi:phosphatidylserine/phosphatidylglycerophosphate/cardiolipin synthase-like enzyme